MTRRLGLVLALLLIAAAPAPPTPPASPPPSPAPAAAPTPAKGSVTGLPLPSFAALSSDDVNLLAGPGTRYPITWVYKRRGLPVEIEREFDVWRLVRDADGTEGWVHEATLTGRRTLLVIGAEQTLRAAPRDDAAIVARAAAGVVGRISHCAADSPWCEVEIKGYRGFLPRTAFWGSFPGEAVN